MTSHRYSTRSKTKPRQLRQRPQQQQDKSPVSKTNQNSKISNNKKNTNKNITRPKRKLQTAKPENDKKKQKVTKKQATNKKKKNKLTLLPPEILRNILSNLVIKDLYNLALCNKTLLNIIQCLPIWNDILTKNHKRIFKHDSMFLVLKDSAKICDLCHLFAKPSGSGAALLTSLIYDKYNKIKLCLDCRRNYYQTHPENLVDIARLEFPDEIDDDEDNIENNDRKITKSRVKTQFKLNDNDINTIQHTLVRNPHGRGFAPMVLYSIYDVLETTLRKHGGYVGLVAERERFKKIAEKRIETARIKGNI